MPSRRSQIEMTKSERTDYIASAQTLIIVSNGKHGYPHPLPMWFGIDDDDSLLCTTFSKSQKVLNWQRDPKASLLIESGTVYSELQGVMIYAQTEILEDHQLVVDTLVKINSRGRELNEEQAAKLRESVQPNARKRVALRFIPERYITWDHRKLGGRY
ncbi:MAG: pyridoxamine 5'-phosphate oxidase [Gammaproteobacteria bacterium]|nr:pyridoxamine 5'-phosphate oxidase [Gammaproteobacteria bacterium]